MSKMKVSIIIPTYEEEKRLGSSLGKITRYMDSKNTDYEIIIIDDNSPDNTIKIAKIFPSKKIKIIRNEKRLGKGASVKMGINKASFPLILICDADLSTPIEEAGKLGKFIDSNEIVIGSRRTPDSDIEKSQSMKRSFFGKIFVLLTRILLGLNFEDTQCGFKLMKKEAAKKIFSIQKIKGYCFDAEILFIAQKLGYRIKEVGTKWIDNPEESKISPIKDGTKMFSDLLKIRIGWWFGLYK